MNRLGKTTPDRTSYSPSFRDNYHQRDNRREYRDHIASFAGETQTVAYQPSTLKADLRAVADERREQRTDENLVRMDALIREARDKGWTLGEIRGAVAAPSIENVRASLRRTAPKTAG